MSLSCVPASVFRTASSASSMDSPVRPGLRLAHQDLVGHLLDASIFAHGALLFLAETLPQGLRCSPKLARTLCFSEAEPLPEN